LIIRLIGDAVQILAVGAFAEFQAQRPQGLESIQPRLKVISYSRALPFFQRMHEVRRFQQRLRRSGVEPCEAATHHLNL
jgi:hypothetical protein